MRNIKIIITLYFLILISLIFGVYNSFGFSIEYDKHFSTYSLALVTNAKSLTKLGFLINDNLFYDYGPRLKIVMNLPSIYIPFLIGHELSHGMTAKKENLDVEYLWLKRKCLYVTSKSPYINSYIACAGLTFENELKDSLYKDQIMNGCNYKSAMSIVLIESSSYVTAKIHDKESNDLNQFCSHMKSINHNTKLTRPYVNNVLIKTSLYDPSFIFNTMFLVHSFWMNQEWTYKFPYIHPNFDFNLYPESITREVGFAKNIRQNHFLKVSYEWGQDVWNKKVKGFSIEVTNIPLYRNIISVDYKYHMVERTLCYSLSTFHISNSYIRWKHNEIKICEIDDDDEFYFGFNFNF